MSEIKVFAKDYPMAPIDKFIPYANNARTHSKEQINKLRSIYEKTKEEHQSGCQRAGDGRNPPLEIMREKI